MGRRYLKYLTKKFLKKHNVRDWLRVIASNKDRKCAPLPFILIWPTAVMAMGEGDGRKGGCIKVTVHTTGDSSSGHVLGAVFCWDDNSMLVLVGT